MALINAGHVIGFGGWRGQVTGGNHAAPEHDLLVFTIQQQNFHQYEVLRMEEMPAVEVHLVPTPNSPGGIGEASTPTIIPAVANAIFAATGKRLRKLPILAEDLA